MIHLCIDVRMAFFSGIGTYIREIIPHLKDHFHLSLLEFDAPIYSIKEQIQYLSKIPECDIFWSPHYNVPLFPIRARKKVVTIHDVCHLALGSFKQKVYARFVMNRALKSDRTLTISEFSQSELKKEFGKFADVIPLGVNLNHFFRKMPCPKVRAKYNLPKEFALFVGSTKAHKNLQGANAACKKAGIDLVAVGKGLLEISQEDLPTLYSMAELFLFPSFYEGFGLPPLEAMACGCPTVVSNVASIPEVCGDASLYFDPNNIDEMAKVIVQAIVQKKELIEKGAKRVKLFDWEKTANRHREIFEEMARA